MNNCGITFLTLIFILELNFLAYGLKDFPPYFPRCRRSDPNLEDCLLKATEEVRPYVTNGIKDFMPGAKNFVVPRIVLEQHGNRAMNFKIKITNLTIQGLEHYKFKRYIYDTENLTTFTLVELPTIYLEGKYDLVGKLFFANLNGNGNFNGNISDSSCAANFTLEIVNRNGVEYLQTIKMVPKMHCGTITNYGFDGLFKDNKDLEIVTTNILKNNLRALVDEITPVVEPVIAAFFKELMSKPMQNIPYDKIYPK